MLSTQVAVTLWQIHPPSTCPLNQSKHINQPFLNPLTQCPTHTKTIFNCPSCSHHQKGLVPIFRFGKGGERTGSIQTSGKLGCIYFECDGNSPTKDTANKVYIEPESFNRYVNPRKGVWFEEANFAAHCIHLQILISLEETKCRKFGPTSLDRFHSMLLHMSQFFLWHTMARSASQGGFGNSPMHPNHLITCHINASFSVIPTR